ncbi:16S rRNA (guanine(966)-N(2))-methyltransferase RsmD [Candidatus Omnitrophota bacterium]
MRVISGIFKRRQLKSPKDVRPTEQKVRKAIFDILSDVVKEASFLELFAGTGAVGIEAVSNGAKEVCFVEKDIRCIKFLKENLTGLGVDSFNLSARDVFSAIALLAKERKAFDVVFLDPPYYQDLAKKTLQQLVTYDIVKPYGFVVVQHFKNDSLEDSYGELSLYTRRRYGTTTLSFYRKET